MPENHVHSRYIYNSYYYDGHRLDPSDLDLKAYIDERIALSPGGGVASITAGTGVTLGGTATNPVINATGVSSYLVYTAKLRIEVSNPATSGNLIIGHTYTITDYVAGDDFTNVANVKQGLAPAPINTTGCVFVATGTTPTDWTNGSTIEAGFNMAGYADTADSSLLFDDTIGNVTWERIGVGQYKALRNGLDDWPARRTWIGISGIETTVLSEVDFHINGAPENSIIIVSEGNDYTYQDQWFLNTSVEIRLYPSVQ